MAIVHMKKLRLMVVRRQKDELLRDLMLLGCVQISEPDALLADAESAAVLRQESGNVTEVRSELTRLTAALKLLDKYAPVKSRLLSSRPEVTEADFLDDGAYRQELDAVAQLEELEAAVRRYNGEEAKLRSNMEALRPWQTLDLPLDLGETVRTRISLGMLPAAVDLAETAKALADAAPESQLYEISSDKEQHYVLLICLKEELTEAITALRASGFTLANLNGAPGTAKQNIEDAQQQIADVTRRREQAETDIAAFAPHRDAFKLCIDRASVKLGRAEAEERLVGTESVVCMRGWLTAPEEAKLTAVLAKYDCAWDLADPTEDEYPEVPVKLQNNKFTEPLNMVTNMYSLPAYGTVDPNPLMAPFFILFYGIMMADMGYGLVMMIAALVALGKMKPKRGSKYFCELLFACGVSTFLLGIVTGGFFGNAVPTIVKMFGHDVKLGILTSPLLDPLTDTTQGRRCDLQRGHLVRDLRGPGAVRAQDRQHRRRAGRAVHRRSDADLRFRPRGQGLRQSHRRVRRGLQRPDRLVRRHSLVFPTHGSDAGRQRHCAGVQHPRRDAVERRRDGRVDDRVHHHLPVGPSAQLRPEPARLLRA